MRSKPFGHLVKLPIALAESVCKESVDHLNQAQLCINDEVVVVGGGNAAGRTAVLLAQSARRVYMLVRRSGLAETMSRYLIRRIEDNPNIVVRARTQLTTLEGNGRLNESDGVTNEPVTPIHDIGHAFIMIGAVPITKSLAECVVLDGNGFVKTGPHLSREELDPAGRSLARSPCLLETSRPGVFAVGDARSSRQSLNSTLEWRPRGTGIQVEKSSMFSKGAAGVRGRRKAAGDAQAGRRPLHPGRRGSRGEERRQPKRAEPATYIVEKVKPLLTEVGGRFPR
jgi:hypothetical protein